jgi:hypothetical protein
MTRVTIVRLGGDAGLSTAQPLRVAGKETGKGGLEPDAVDTVTVSFVGCRTRAQAVRRLAELGTLPPETTAR